MFFSFGRGNCRATSKRGAATVGGGGGGIERHDDEKQLRVRQVRARPDPAVRQSRRSAVPTSGGVALLTALGGASSAGRRGHGGGRRRGLLPPASSPAFDRVRVRLRRHGQGHAGVTGRTNRPTYHTADYM